MLQHEFLYDNYSASAGITNGEMALHRMPVADVCRPAVPEAVNALLFFFNALFTVAIADMQCVNVIVIHSAGRPHG